MGIFNRAPKHDSASWNAQVQAMHKQAQAKTLTSTNPLVAPHAPLSASTGRLRAPAKPASTQPRPPLAAPAPVVPSSEPAAVTGLSVAQPYGGALSPDDPAAIGGAAMAQPKPDVAQPPKADPVADATKAYRDSFAPSPDSVAAQEGLDRIAANQAMLRANAADGTAKVAEQAIPMGFITGQSAAIQRQLAASLGQEAAQAVPLAAKLAAAQAAAAARQNQAKVDMDAAAAARDAAKPIQVGNSLVRPTADGKYESVYSAPEKAAGLTEVSPGATLVDASGKAVFTAPGGSGSDSSRGIAVGGNIVDPVTGRVIYQGDPAADLTEGESKARGFHSAALQANTELESNPYLPDAFESPWTITAFRSPERQQFDRSTRAFVNAVLRRDSGATITTEEFKNKYAELIPVRGDSPQVIADKKRARDEAVRQLEAAGRVRAAQPQGATMTTPDGTVWQQGADGNWSPKA